MHVEIEEVAAQRLKLATSRGGRRPAEAGKAGDDKRHEKGAREERRTKGAEKHRAKKDDEEVGDRSRFDRGPPAAPGGPFVAAGHQYMARPRSTALDRRARQSGPRVRERRGTTPAFWFAERLGRTPSARLRHAGEISRSAWRAGTANRAS